MGNKLAGSVLCVLALLGAKSSVRERSFSFEYQVTVKDLPEGAGRVEVWIPVPHDDPYQRIARLEIHAPYPYEITTGDLGNTILHMKVDHPHTGFPVSVRFGAARTEHRQPAPEPPGSPELARALRPDRLVPLDDQVRTWANQIVREAHARTDLEKGRAIYDHVVSTMKYDKSGTGWGKGDLYYACSRRRGNCTDFHAMFIGFCRAVGIPARFSIGFPLPADRGAGSIAGYHCWAEFYARGVGWVPVDCSEAAKDPAKRQYFFGAHDENRIQFSRGRDLVLTPPQHGEPLNYFIYPYIEVDGKPYSGIATRYSYSDLGGAAAGR